MVMSLRSKWAAGPALAGRSEPDWQQEGAYLDRYVTDEPRRRQPIFNAMAISNFGLRIAD
jgi:hypothetical protein